MVNFMVSLPFLVYKGLKAFDQLFLSEEEGTVDGE